MANEWNIRSRSHQCHTTGRPFVEGEEFYTLLYETKEGVERKDLSTEAWRERQINPAPLSSWKNTYKPAPPPEQETIQKEDVESELRRLLESENPHDAKVSYLLAIMLERKRILKFRERVAIRGHGGSIYEHTKTHETFFIQEPDIKLDELDDLQLEIKASSSKIFATIDTDHAEECES